MISSVQKFTFFLVLFSFCNSVLFILFLLSYQSCHIMVIKGFYRLYYINRLLHSSICRNSIFLSNINYFDIMTK